MASGTVIFQSTTLATPAANLSVMADAVNDSDHGAGTTQYVKIMDATTAGTAKASVTTANGLAVDVTRVQGTVQALGTLQPLAGSVHVANTLPGTVQALGTVQTHGTSQALGTVQPLAGSVHLASILPGGSVSAQGYVGHGVLVAGNPVLAGAFGSSGTQAAQGDGSVVRLWADPNGRLHVRGTVDSLPSVTGTVQTHGTSQVVGTIQAHGTTQALGTVQPHGTSQALGTVQPLAGSVHLASNLPGGSINAQGVIAHGAGIAGNPQLWGAFGSSGTQGAVGDGQLTRLWADLNGRLQVRGTIDSLPNVTIGGGTVGAAGGTFTVVGTVQTHGTSQAIGTFQAHGTAQVLGTAAHPPATTHSVIRTAATVGNITLLGATPARKGAAFFLESAGSTMYLKLGSSAGTFDYTLQVAAGGYYEVPFGYTGTIAAIWQFASGTVMITELT